VSEHLAIVVLAVACGVLAAALALKPGPEPHTCPPCVERRVTDHLTAEERHATPPPAPPDDADLDELTRWLESRARQ